MVLSKAQAGPMAFVVQNSDSALYINSWTGVRHACFHASLQVTNKMGIVTPLSGADSIRHGGTWHPPTFTNGWALGHRELKNSKQETGQTLARPYCPSRNDHWNIHVDQKSGRPTKQNCPARFALDMCPPLSNLPLAPLVARRIVLFFVAKETVSLSHSRAHPQKWAFD